MRLAIKDYNLIYDSDDDTKVIGVSFGYDHTAEHEWGIKGLRQLLGVQETDFEKQKKRIKKKELGVTRRQVRSVEHVWTGSFIKNQLEYSYLYVGHRYNIDPKKIEDNIQSQIGSHIESMIEKESVATAWSEKELCFVVSDRGIVESFKTQMEKGNMFLGSFYDCNPFSNPSLTLIQIDKMPEEFKQNLLDTDVDAINLAKADEATGIKKDLAKKKSEWRKDHPNCSYTPWDYMALSSSWGNKEKNEVRYWLNPSVQSLVNYGWYTIDDLQNWIDEVPNKIVPEENWAQLKWECSDSNFSRLTYEYPDFLPYDPKYHSVNNLRGGQKRSIKANSKTHDQDFQVIIEHILSLYVRDTRDRVEVLGESLSQIRHPRQEIEDRVFGFCEAMSLLGLGTFGACNTPKNKTNFSWLKDILAIQAWFLIAKEKGYITEDDEEKFLKPTIRRQ